MLQACATHIHLFREACRRVKSNCMYNTAAVYLTGVYNGRGLVLCTLMISMRRAHRKAKTSEKANHETSCRPESSQSCPDKPWIFVHTECSI